MRFPFGLALVVLSSLARAPVPQSFTTSCDDIKNLDPQLVTGINEQRILAELFEGLVRRDPETSAPIPGVAEKWSASANGLRWTFTLRADARWSNGDPLTASDFVYAWQRLLDPRLAAEYAYQGFYLRNGERYYRRQIADPSLLGVRARDARTLEVTLEHPVPFFLGLLDTPPLFPLHRATVERFGDRWTRPENLVSNGPFSLVSWEQKREVKLKKSASYWDRAQVRLDEVHFLLGDSVETDERLFRVGQLDWALQVPPEKIEQWRKDRSGVFHSDPQLSVAMLKLNVTRKALKDKRVRRALSLAIDRARLTRYVTRGGELPAGTLTPPYVKGYLPPPSRIVGSAEEEEARRLLAEAGFQGGKGFPAIELRYGSNVPNRIMEAIQFMWKRALGIEVSLHREEQRVYSDTLRTLSYQIGAYSWGADYNDPNTFLDIFASGGGNNQTGFSNKAYDDLLQAAAREADEKKRMALLRKAEGILLDEQPVIPLYFKRRNYLLSRGVRGWHSNPEDIHPLKYVSVRAD